MNKFILLFMLSTSSQILSLPAATLIHQDLNDNSDTYLKQKASECIHGTINLSLDEIPNYVYKFYLSLGSSFLSEYHFKIYLKILDWHLPKKFKSTGTNPLSWESFLVENNINLLFFQNSNGLFIKFAKEIHKRSFISALNEHSLDKYIYQFYAINESPCCFCKSSFESFTDKIKTLPLETPEVSWTGLLDWINKPSTSIQESETKASAKIIIQLPDLILKLKRCDNPSCKSALLYNFYLSNLDELSLPSEFALEPNYLEIVLENALKKGFVLFLSKTSALISEPITWEGFLSYIDNKKLDTWFDSYFLEKRVFLENLGKVIQRANSCIDYEEDSKVLIEHYGKNLDREALAKYLKKFNIYKDI